jgi:hypothetical protein
MLFGFSGILSTYVEGLWCFRYLALAFDNGSVNLSTRTHFSILMTLYILTSFQFLHKKWKFSRSS